MHLLAPLIPTSKHKKAPKPRTRPEAGRQQRCVAWPRFRFDDDDDYDDVDDGDDDDDDDVEDDDGDDDYDDDDFGRQQRRVPALDFVFKIQNTKWYVYISHICQSRQSRVRVKIFRVMYIFFLSQINAL